MFINAPKISTKLTNILLFCQQMQKIGDNTKKINQNGKSHPISLTIMDIKAMKKYLCMAMCLYQKEMDE